jgi:hypothetical protein
MAFQAHGVDNGPSQQARVHGAVRCVARLASVYPDGWVLEQERSPKIDVAFQTRLFIAEGLIYHPRA